ncbi:adhesin domain containing protein [Finegoldia magna]|uniref:adhesin domain containing protein n=1 Tax=Finegoldia magna TaxID=1260 RepID=UPI001CE034D0|nr:adhesin domain containing protein [Finegoldia magna]MCA5587288.1 hypothetical protein [Finegoldia magna]
MKINKKLLMAALASAVIVSAPQVKAYTLSNAESVATNTELGRSEGKQQAAVRAPQKATGPNYANDEKNVGTYKETQLERGNGPATIYTPPTEMDKFIDGFRYSTVEPGATSPDKTLWGFEIEFDRDQGQRTYTDFSFTNSGNMGGYLDTGSIPAKSPEDGSLGDNFKTPNYKASTEIAITGSRAQRNLNGYATEKDLQHINNVDNNNTTMAWEGHYSKDNTSAPFATKGSSSAFGFTVNPWPNENDQLDLITLSGEHTNREFVNGQKITTGVKVANLDDSARERLVGQVYHPSTGEVVPGAKAYIDDKGNVVVEMPKGAVDEKGNINEDSIFYKDPNYKGIQNLEVKFFARPRTAEEFKAIAGEYSGTYTETGAGTETINHKGESITIDKQGIARYDHYNLVGKFNLNIDDTAFHDQTYRNKDIKTGKIVDTTSQSAIGIRRGETLDVDNQTSKDEMDGLVKDKNAHAKIDKTFFDKENKGKDPDDQWKLTYNDELSNIKVTAPKLR